MSELTDTQLVILSAAADREDGAIFPVPASIKAKGGALANVVESMINRGLISECAAGPEDQIWRQNNDGNPQTLCITETGLNVMGVTSVGHEEQSGPALPIQNMKVANKTLHNRTSSAESSAYNATSARKANKQAVMISLLKREAGASIAEVMAATGWQAHSVRGAISGTLKKKLGLTITSEKIEGRGRVYRVFNGDGTA